MEIATEHRGPMRAGKILAGMLLVAGAWLLAQDASPPAGQSSPQSSSKSTGHRSGHPVKVPLEESQPEELTQAETAIERENYAAAEPLLRKLVERQPANYVAWFDLGFVENSLGRLDDSIAAYRKSVAAKPDVFESNLNLGLQLAKTGQAGAEEFLRAATRLKPTSNGAEGQYRAWLSLAQTIAKTKPEEALAAYQQAETFQPKEPEPHLSAGRLLEEENKFAEAEQEYKQALAIDSRSVDAVIGLANIYMRGHRFPEAEDYLRKLMAEHADSAPVHIQLGRVLAAVGKTDAAISELQAGLTLAPGEGAAQRETPDLSSPARENDIAGTSYPAVRPLT